MPGNKSFGRPSRGNGSYRQRGTPSSSYRYSHSNRQGEGRRRPGGGREHVSVGAFWSRMKEDPWSSPFFGGEEQPRTYLSTTDNRVLCILEPSLPSERIESCSESQWWAMTVEDPWEHLY
jgi:hypothetical protein